MYEEKFDIFEYYLKGMFSVELHSRRFSSNIARIRKLVGVDITIYVTSILLPRGTMVKRLYSPV